MIPEHETPSQTLAWAMGEVGITPRSLAEALGKKTDTVLAWMSGSVDPKASDYLAALHACGIDIVYQTMEEDHAP